MRNIGRNEKGKRRRAEQEEVRLVPNVRLREIDLDRFMRTWEWRV